MLQKTDACLSILLVSAYVSPRLYMRSWLTNTSTENRSRTLRPKNKTRLRTGRTTGQRPKSMAFVVNCPQPFSNPVVFSTSGAAVAIVTLCLLSENHLFHWAHRQHRLGAHTGKTESGGGHTGMFCRWENGTEGKMKPKPKSTDEWILHSPPVKNSWDHGTILECAKRSFLRINAGELQICDWPKQLPKIS